MSDSGTAVRMRRLALAMMPLVLVCAGAWLAVKPGAQGGGRGGRKKAEAVPRRSLRSAGMGMNAEAEPAGENRFAGIPEEVRALLDLSEMTPGEFAERVKEEMKKYPLETMRLFVGSRGGYSDFGMAAMMTVAREMPPEELQTLMDALRTSPNENRGEWLEYFFERTGPLPSSAEVKEISERERNWEYRGFLRMGLGMALAAEAAGRPEQPVSAYANAGMAPEWVQEVNDSMLEGLRLRVPERALTQLEAHWDDDLYSEEARLEFFKHLGARNSAEATVREQVLALAEKHGDDRTLKPFLEGWAFPEPLESSAWVLTIPKGGLRDRAARVMIGTLGFHLLESGDQEQWRRKFTEAGVDLLETQ